MTTYAVVIVRNIGAKEGERSDGLFDGARVVVTPGGYRLTNSNEIVELPESATLEATGETAPATHTLSSDS